MPTWNLFNRSSGRKVGTADGETREEVERVAREHLGLNVDADTQRGTEVPRGGLWGRLVGAPTEDDDG
jgi:hypothetical protein